MKNFNNSTAAAIVDEILHLFDVEYISQHIIEPVDKAAAEYSYTVQPPISHQIFLRVVADFIKHYYTSNPHISEKLTDIQAEREVVDLLDRYYQGQNDRGYLAAYLDAIDKENPDLESVLLTLKESVITIAINKHVRWVLSSRIDQADWHGKCRITWNIYKKFKNILPSHILQCPVEQFADHIPRLISLILSSNSPIDKILISEIYSLNLERSA